MPRTSYGDTKRDRAWKLVAALMERQGTPGVQLCRYGDRQFYLMVEASLLNMRAWAELTIEEVREALNEHLGESFLGIVIDREGQRSGRGAEQWKFKLRLWSTDLAENRQQFDEAWQTGKPGNPSLSSSLQENNLDALVQQLKERCRQRILNQHSRMRLLNQCEIGVDQLYPS